MSLSILSIGTATPNYSISQDRAATIAKKFCSRNEKESTLLDTLYRRTRIEKRGSVLLQEENETLPQHSFFSQDFEKSLSGPTTAARMEYFEKEALPLALRASQKALLESGLSPAKITHLITVSCTGFAAPGVDIALIKNLGLKSSVARTHIGFMGCHGAFNGLRIAQAISESSPEAKILLCAYELCSLHFHFGWDPEKMVANGLFADGAGAFAASQEPSPFWKLVTTGSYLFPNSEDAMTWKISDHGFKMTLSSQVPTLIKTHLKGWLENWLKENQLKLSDIHSWAIHPGGPRILDTVRESLDLSKEATALSEKILAEHGNMSSATILFILKNLWEENAPRPCVALGFGPGLALEAALLV